MTLVVAINSWRLRATSQSVAYINDAAIHEQMVRYATSYFTDGRDPLGGWFPFINLGSPQFEHYQNLPALITGAFGLLAGADTAFRWSLYVLLAGWPIAIYASTRILRLSSAVALTCSAVAPLIGSVPQVGFEQGAYLWVGYGLWAQLWASWLLPLAWATTWRATTDRRFVLPAALCVAGTTACHYETGYLAIAAVLLFPFLSHHQLRRRIALSGSVLMCSFLLAAWALVPLVTNSRWAALNETLRGTPLENGYGLKQLLDWLFTGRVFDGGAFPGLSLALVAGGMVAVARWRKEPQTRAIVAMASVSLLLSAGRTTFGSLVDLIPGSHDVFFRRYMVGLQLAGIFLAGIGLVATCQWSTRAIRWVYERVGPLQADGGNPATPRYLRVPALVGALILIAVVLGPGCVRVGALDERNGTQIHAQIQQQREAAPSINAILRYVEGHGEGRVYAGTLSNWGAQFTIGAVPVFKYLASADVDEVGFTLRTASLMSQPETHFEDSNPSDYALFGVRYLLLPVRMNPPVSATLTMTRGRFALWTILSNSYIDIEDTIGVLDANRMDLGSNSLPYVDSDAFGDHREWAVAWAGAPAAVLTNRGVQRAGSTPGRVISESVDLLHGDAKTTVDLVRPATVVLSASYDPGWTVSVDGHVAKTEMLAPAIVGVTVPAGVQHVEFLFRGFGQYPMIFALGLFGFGVGAAITMPAPGFSQQKRKGRSFRTWVARTAHGGRLG